MRVKVQQNLRPSEEGPCPPQCAFDPVTDGSPAGLNPALIYVGDLTLSTLVAAIHRSPLWKQGNNAIVIVWDEKTTASCPT
jgi:hypothetical protein